MRSCRRVLDGNLPKAVIGWPSPKTSRPELQHRLKNTLVVVRAIANQTLKTATSLDEAKSVLSKRIGILGKAHDILLQDSGSSADLVGIVGAMVDLHAGRRERFVIGDHGWHVRLWRT